MYGEHEQNEQEQPDLVPPGRHRARASQWDIGTTNGGSEQVGISFALLDLPGRYLPYYGQFGEKSLEHTIKAMRACGWQGIDLSDLTGLGENEVSLVVEHETYEGKTRAKVKWVNETGGAMLKNVLDPASKTSFANRMRGQIAALGAGKPPARPVQQQQQRSQGFRPEPPPHTDNDDIGF